MGREPDYLLDLRGTFPQLSLLKVTRLFREMQPRQVIEILGCYSELRRDLCKLLPSTGYELTEAVGDGEDPPGRVRLTKTEPSDDDAQGSGKPSTPFEKDTRNG